LYSNDKEGDNSAFLLSEVGVQTTFPSWYLRMPLTRKTLDATKATKRRAV
jgi:hypothetical protein